MLVNLLLEKFLSGDSFERENISYIVHEIFQAFLSGDSPYQQTKYPPSLKNLVSEESFIETFFKVIVNPESSSSSVGYAANTLSVIVTYFNSRLQKSGYRNSSHHSDDDDICNVTSEEEKC